MSDREVIEHAVLHLFTVHGATFTFHRVTISADNETELVFTYAAVSDGRLKQMRAYKRNLVGHSFG